jgi:hypothetical protein
MARLPVDRTTTRRDSYKRQPVQNIEQGVGWSFGFPTLPRVLLATTVAGVILYLSAMGAGTASTGSRMESSPECARLARAVASRSHSILDGARVRATERQAYDVCAADPAAFRRLVRGY